jgi:hypothetical protein
MNKVLFGLGFHALLLLMLAQNGGEGSSLR